jgi:hypothetical protein
MTLPFFTGLWPTCGFLAVDYPWRPDPQQFAPRSSGFKHTSQPGPGNRVTPNVLLQAQISIFCCIGDGEFIAKIVKRHNRL